MYNKQVNKAIFSNNDLYMIQNKDQASILMITLDQFAFAFINTGFATLSVEQVNKMW